MVRNDTAVLLRDIRLGASAWLNSLLDNGKTSGKSSNRPVGLQLWACLRRPLTLLVHLLRLEKPVLSNYLVSEAVRKSCSEAALTGTSTSSSSDHENNFVMSRTCQELGKDTPASSRQSLPDQEADARAQAGGRTSAGFNQEGEEGEEGQRSQPGEEGPRTTEFPGGFQPLRSDTAAANIKLQTTAIVKNPFMSPLLAPDEMLRGLPPIHLVACALDPMLDDSVMFAKRLRNAGQTVSLRVVEDLPHGFLSLSHLSRETKEASNICVVKIREVLQGPAAAASQTRKHRKLERVGAKPAPAAEVRQPEDLTVVSNREIGA